MDKAYDEDMIDEELTTARIMKSTKPLDEEISSETSSISSNNSNILNPKLKPSLYDTNEKCNVNLKFTGVFLISLGCAFIIFILLLL